MRKVVLCAGILVIGNLGSKDARGAESGDSWRGPGVRYTGIDPESLGLKADDSPLTNNGIQFHGGPVMGALPDLSDTPTIYYIWYGSLWPSDPSAITILENYANFVGGSPYFNIQTSYYDRFGNIINNTVNFGGSYFDSGSQGTSLTMSTIRTIVDNALASGLVPVDNNGVYFVITDRNINVSGLCTSLCGWHTHYTSSRFGDIKYSFVGSPLHCPTSGGQCTRQRTNSPNNNPNADGIVNLIAHEFEEAVTDPDLNAWFASDGENADKCAWTFGQTYVTPNGSLANMNIGGLDYLIQRNWVNDFGGYCDLSY